MKKLLLFSVSILLYGAMNAQVTYADFESDASHPIFVAFSQTTTQVVDDPKGSDRGKVLEIVKGAEVWDGTQFYTGGKFNYAGTDTTFTVWVYCEDTTTIAVGNQNNPRWQNVSQKAVAYDTPGEWKQMSFTMAQGSEGGANPEMMDDYNTWTIVTHFYTSGTDMKPVFIDDIASAQVSTTLFESNKWELQVTDLQGGNSYSVKVNGGDKIDLVADGDVHTAEVDVTPYYYTDGQDDTNWNIAVEFYRGDTFLEEVVGENSGSSSTRQLAINDLGEIESGVYTAPRVDAAPKIDGVADGVWTELAENGLLNELWASDIEDVHFKMCYDFDNVYVLVAAKDPHNYSEEEKVDAPWENTNTELFFDMGHEASNPYDANDYQIRYEYGFDRFSGNVSTDRTPFDWETFGADIERAQGEADGYTYYEWAIPFTSLYSSFAPLTGVTFGFDCSYASVADGETSRTGINTWYYEADEAYFNASIFGTITLGSPLAVKDIAESNIEVYPNPAQNVLYVEGDAKTVEIFNLAGVSIQKHNVSSTLSSLSVADLNAGIYIVKVTDASNNSYSHRLIKK